MRFFAERMPIYFMTITEYRRTPYWREMRAVMLRNANYQCQECGLTRNLELHHKVYRGFFRERRGDLMILCRYCHETHHYPIWTWEQIEQWVRDNPP